MALTLVNHEDEKHLVDTVKKIHKVEIKKLDSLQVIADEVEKCIKTNSLTENDKPIESVDKPVEKEVEKPKEVKKPKEVEKPKE